MTQTQKSLRKEPFLELKLARRITDRRKKEEDTKEGVHQINGLKRKKKRNLAKAYISSSGKQIASINFVYVVCSCRYKDC